MAVGLVMTFQGLGAQRYDAIMRELGLTAGGGNWPDGIISHAAGATQDGWCVVDVWESQERFDRFLNGRLRPAFDATGGQQEPEVIAFEIRLLHEHGGELARSRR
jgi:hypothetical protein